MSVKITQGNVLDSKVEGIKVIGQCVNDIGVMGSGVAKAIMDKWPVVREKYLQWAKTIINFKLGSIQILKVEPDTVVCNIIGQKGVGFEEIDGVRIPAVRYFAIYEGLLRLRERINTSENKNVSVHLPLIGAGLAGGSINQTYQTVWDVFGTSDISCTLYAFSYEDMVDLRRSAINFGKKFEEQFENEIEYIQSGCTDKM